MSAAFLFYMCTSCFEVRQAGCDCHEREMIRCDAGRPGAERRKPIEDADGRLRSRAPLWFLEAVGWVPAGYPPVDSD